MKLPKLVANWQTAYRWYTIHAQALGTVLSAGGAAYSAATSAGNVRGVPIWAVCLVFTGVFVAGIIGRLIDQTPTAKS